MAIWLGERIGRDERGLMTRPSLAEVMAYRAEVDRRMEARLADASYGFGPDDPDPEARLVWATCGGIRVASAYVPNGRSPDDDHYRYKLDWLARLAALLEDQHTPDESVVIAGDFNIAPTDLDVWDPSKFIDSTHTTPAEREALDVLVRWGLVDTFRLKEPGGGLFSWWDYRAGSFHKKQGMRIDLVLASAPVAARLAFATIDRNARKGQQPSDHAPVVIDLDD